MQTIAIILLSLVIIYQWLKIKYLKFDRDQYEKDYERIIEHLSVSNEKIKRSHDTLIKLNYGNNHNNN